MAAPVGNPGDAADAVRSAKAGHDGWQHLRLALGRSLPDSIKTAKRLARSTKRGRR